MIRFTLLFSWKRRSGGALVKRITYHLREIWYALRHFREVNPVLLANPVNCSGRQKFCGGLHSETRQSVPLLWQPAIEYGVTHSGSICQFVFVCAFHGLLFLTTDNWLQTTDLSVVFFVTKLLKINELCKKIFAYLFKSFRKFSTPRKDVVTLYRESWHTQSRLRT